MTEEKDNNVMQTREEVNRLIDGLTLFDDDLMSRVFDKNIAATELILRIILGRKIKVIRVNGQEEVRNSEVGGRNITLDVYALDENGEEMDIEVQGNSKERISDGQDTTVVYWIPECCKRVRDLRN